MHKLLCTFIYFYIFTWLKGKFPDYFLLAILDFFGTFRTFRISYEIPLNPSGQAKLASFQTEGALKALNTYINRAEQKFFCIIQKGNFPFSGNSIFVLPNGGFSMSGAANTRSGTYSNKYFLYLVATINKHR